MGFLNIYAATEKIYVGTDADTQWWVEIRISLTKADYDGAQESLGMSAFRFAAGQSSAATTMNLTAYQTEVVARSIVNWNLTDENDVMLPIGSLAEKRTSLARLPQSVFNAIYERVNEYNTPSSEARQSFRPQDNGGRPSGANDQSEDSTSLA
jgi:hypothetical protein